MTWSDRWSLELKGNYYLENPKWMTVSRGTILRKGIHEREAPTKNSYELTPIRTFESSTTHVPLPFSIDPKQSVLGVNIGQDLLILIAFEEFVFLLPKLPVSFIVTPAVRG
jgi:hypothetical protein